MVFTADLPEEGAETYALLDQIRAIAAEYYGDDVVLVGNSTNARDLAASFTGDNLKISVLTVLFVVVILLFTFKSAGAHHPGLHLDQLLLPLPDGHQPVFYELPDCQRHTDGRYH